ncbi:MAG TPA: universal stress protein, partial [Usitatibacter sp.]|nr:universal stress protein [Usitatibacter sp.]
MYRHILVPTDGSQLSNKAAKTAAGLAKVFKAKITALHVIAPYSPPSGGDGVIMYAEAFSPQEYNQRMQKLADKALAKVEAQARALKVA